MREFSYRIRTDEYYHRFVTWRTCRCFEFVGPSNFTGEVAFERESEAASAEAGSNADQAFNATLATGMSSIDRNGSDYVRCLPKFAPPWLYQGRSDKLISMLSSLALAASSVRTVGRASEHCRQETLIWHTEEQSEVLLVWQSVSKQDGGSAQ